MKVIREKSILEKIDAEIDDTTKPSIVRIDLDEDEFEGFIINLSKCVISLDFDGTLTGLKHHLIKKVSRSNINKRGGNWRGSYVVYRGVSVQCYYEKE